MSFSGQTEQLGRCLSNRNKPCSHKA